MSLFQSIKRVFARSERDSGLTSPLDPRSGQAWWLSFPFIPDGMALSPHQVFEVSAVWACCNIIALNIAAAPWYMLGVAPNGRRSKLPNDALAFLLNVSPNGETTAQAYKEALIFQALIHGNGYAEIQRNGAGRVVKLQPLMSERMLSPTRDEQGNLVYDYTNPNGAIVRLRAANVFHLRGPSLEGLVGQGTVLAASKAIATAAAADRFTGSYYANAATPSGVLSVTKTLQPKEREELKTEFATKHSAHRNNGKPLVLDNGMTFTPIGNDPQKSQLIEGRRFSVEEIARYFGVPLFMLAEPQGSQGYGRNLSEMGHALINYTLTPWTKRLEQEAAIKLIPASDHKVSVIDLSHLSRGTEKEQAESDEIRIRSGVVTINECRETLGLNHGPEELDHHFVLTTVQPVEKALAPPPAAPGAPAPNGGSSADPEQDGEGGSQIGVDAPVDPNARALLATVLTRSLRDHERRWKARTKDLRAHVAPQELETRLSAARDELRTKLAAELDEFSPAATSMGQPFNPAALAEAVEAGADCTAVASHHLGV